MPAWRQDPYDNQCGELMVDGRGLDAPSGRGATSCWISPLL